MIQARLLRDEVISELSETWHATGALRVEHVLDEAQAAAALEALRAEAHAPELQPTADGYQLWRFPWVPEPACSHTMCAVGRSLLGEVREWVQQVTGQPLAPLGDRMLVSDMHHKGMYIEPYDDREPGRVVAFQLGLTPATWPEAWGGHLEELEGPDGAVRRTWAPAWNHLDLFDVRKPAWRRLPILREHVEGYVISGWYG